MVLKFNTPDVVFNDPSSDDAAVPALEEGEEDLSEDGSEDESEDDLSGEEISDVDEEPGKPSEKIANPFYDDSKEGESDDSSDFNSDDDSDDDENSQPNPKPEDAEEDDLIKALKAAREKKARNAPPDIKLSELVTDISFHPEADVVAVANIDGDISLFKYSNEKNTLEKKLKLHKKTVRAIEFDSEGKHLFSVAKDKSLKVLDVEAQEIKYKMLKCHDSPLYSVKPIDNNLCVTGDEDGVVKLWDFRTEKSVMECRKFDEFVSSFLVSDDGKTLVAASGEGTIQSFNLRGRRPDIQSEVYDGEMTCLGSVKSGSKLVAGSSSGTLYMFNWDQFGYHSDQFPGHPDSINAMIPITENVVITACEDGLIRALHLYPHRFLGVVGQHESDLPVEILDVNTTGEVVASASHDNRVKFWNVQYLEEMDYDKTRKPQNQHTKTAVRRKSAKLAAAREDEHQLPSSSRQNRADFFKGFKD